MSQNRRTAPPATGNAARTASNPTTEVPGQSTFHADLIAAVTGRLAAVTAVELVDPDTTERHIRLRPHMTLKGAENAVLAAWDRGHRAEVVVVHLIPVRIGGGL